MNWNELPPPGIAAGPEGECLQMVARRAMIIGTAGHIDHGKTALVKA